MAKPFQASAAAMLFERNDALVIEAFRRGEFDYLDGVGEIPEADFLRAIASNKVLDKLADSYPSPRSKHDVPLWVYIASDISMRFHGEHHFHAFPYIVRTGGLIEAFGSDMGHRATHPQTGDITLACEGFNDKNQLDRQTPCDQDYLRKMARDTDAELLHQWFNRDVAGILKQHHALDPEGIFIADATYLFVPDNPKYEGSSVLLFDESNHPVSDKDLTPEKRARCTLRRCYKMVSLLHTNRKAEFFYYVGVRVVSGADHEGPVLHDLVEDFVNWHGKKTMKWLILDRGFLDGEWIGRCKTEWNIDVLIPARSNMNIYTDVVGLAEGGMVDFEPWIPPPPPPRPVPLNRPESIVKREESRQRTLAERKTEAQKGAPPSKTPALSEVGMVTDLETYSSCPVPLTAIVNRETDAEGDVHYWVLLTTAEDVDPHQVRRDYALRTTIEERHRQLKCFSDLEKFTSRAFSLVVNQIVFTLLTYTLMQWFLVREGRKDLTSKTRKRALQLLEPSKTVIIIYYQHYVAYLSPLDHQELVLTLEEEPRKNILTKTRKIRHHMADELQAVRPA